MARHGYSDLSTRTSKQENEAPALSRAEVRDIILDISVPCTPSNGEDSGVRIARKHLGWYCEQLLADSVQIRRSLMAASTTSAQFALAHDHLEDWVDRGPARPGW